MWMRREIKSRSAAGPSDAPSNEALSVSTPQFVTHRFNDTTLPGFTGSPV